MEARAGTAPYYILDCQGNVETVCVYRCECVILGDGAGRDFILHQPHLKVHVYLGWFCDHSSRNKSAVKSVQGFQCGATCTRRVGLH